MKNRFQITKEDRDVLKFAAEDLNCSISEVIETLKYNCILESVAEQIEFLKTKKEEEKVKSEITNVSFEHDRVKDVFGNGIVKM